MDLLARVDGAMTAAMRARDRVTLAPLRMLKTALVNRRVELGRALDDIEAQRVAASLVKQRRDSIEQFSRAGRMELVERERAEMAVLETFLPPPMDEADVVCAINTAITGLGASSPKDMGRVMKRVMAELSDQPVDGAAVSRLVKQRLTGAD